MESIDECERKKGHPQDGLLDLQRNTTFIPKEKKKTTN